MTTILILLCAALVYTLVYINDRPGGLSDRRMSKALGLSDTLHIPLGDTPQDALQQLGRLQSTEEVIYRETVEGGVLLFMTRPNADASNLRVEYIRKTWLGWKWVWGGGFSMSEPLQTKAALNYMNMPKLDHVSTPFPMVFGEIRDSSINNITAEIKGAEKHHAKLAEAGPNKKIWFVFLPSSAFTPFDIEGLNAEGARIAHKTISDPNDSDLIDLIDLNIQ